MLRRPPPPRLPPRRFLPRCLLPRLLPCSLLFSPTLAPADPADAFNFKAAAQTLHDDNFFRAAERNKPRPETVATATLGIDFDRRISRQQLSGNIAWVATRHGNFRYLDADSLFYDGRWAWALGSHLSGELAAERSAVQNSFTDIQNTRQRNLRRSESQRFSLDYAPLSSWHLQGGVSHRVATNEALMPEQNDIEIAGAHAGLRYVSGAGNALGWQARQSRGRYLKQPPDPLRRFDDEFSQPGQEFNFDWNAGGKGRLNGRIEHIRRRHPHFAERDYAGWNGQLAYLYRYSGKTTLSATWQRAINSFRDTVSAASRYTHYVADEAIFATHWAATGKTEVAARLAFSQRRYVGDIAPLAAEPVRRQDEGVRFTLEALHAASRGLELKAGFAVEKRTSNNSNFDYSVRQIFLSATAHF